MSPSRAAVVRWLPFVLLVLALGCGMARSFPRIAADKEARLRKLLEERGGRVVKFQSKMDGPQDAKITVAFTDNAWETPDGKKEDSITEQEYYYALKDGKWAFVNGGFQTGFSGPVQGNRKPYLSEEELSEIMARMPQ
jgi:hypothetical protein